MSAVERSNGHLEFPCSLTLSHNYDSGLHFTICDTILLHMRAVYLCRQKIAHIQGAANID
jgi:hypothetical protein